jgi:hypothetical protein
MSQVHLSFEVRSALESASCSGRHLFLPRCILRDGVFEAVTRILRQHGGHWNLRSKAHLFETPAEDAIRKILADSDAVRRRTEMQQGFTRIDVAIAVARQAQVDRFVVLEPSAGHGALADACMAAGAFRVQCGEINRDFAAICRSKGYRTDLGDFLASPRQFYHRIVMAPPTNDDADIVHVAAALHRLHHLGNVTALVPDRQERPAFQALIQNRNATLTPVPDLKAIILTIHN